MQRQSFMSRKSVGTQQTRNAKPGTHGLQDPLVEYENTSVNVKVEGPSEDHKKSLTKENNHQSKLDDSCNNASDKKMEKSIQDIVDMIEEEEFDQKPTKRCNLGPYILALAMGIHAAFAGLALGLSKDMNGFIGLLIAVLAHKWAEALTVGINFAKNLEDIGVRQAIMLMFIFSLATPIGMAVGLALKGIDDLWQSILFGVSAGTFIYISTTEIIVEEFSVTRHKWAKFFSYLVGIGLMVSIYFIEQATGG